MSLYAIGDIHGCYDSFRRLLDKINFDENNDSLWLTGDLVGRGTQSLETLRFLESIKNNLVSVMGNHDLHLLALYYHVIELDEHSRNLEKILDAPDSDKLISWLKDRPFLHFDNNRNILLVHAGIHPEWTINESITYANELEGLLQGEQSKNILENMYGNDPIKWSLNLNSYNRYRFLINVFTRMRVLNSDNNLDLKYKGTEPSSQEHIHSWFKSKNHNWKDTTIIFGHWSALGLMIKPQFICLDSGCVWGRNLTAINLDSRFKVTKISHLLKNPI